MNWSVRPDKKFRLAIGSFLEDYTNSVRIIQLNPSTGNFVTLDTFDHPYPPTKIQWVPDKLGVHSDLLATSGDFLRIWGSESDASGASRFKLRALLSNNRNSEFCAPLTSFDWNESDPTTIATSSIDTTCMLIPFFLFQRKTFLYSYFLSLYFLSSFFFEKTGTIWDVPKQVPKTQLIAHDKEVYDIAFSTNRNIFSTVGADGSLRMFDLRQLAHSTIIYETGSSGSPSKPLLRLGWNKQDDNYIATIAIDSAKAIMLDIRLPSVPVVELQGHGGVLNALAWAPHSSCHLATAGEDCRAFIWDLTSMPKPLADPVLAYTAESEINQLQWSSSQSDWTAISFAQKLQILRV